MLISYWGGLDNEVTDALAMGWYKPGQPEKQVFSYPWRVQRLYMVNP